MKWKEFVKIAYPEEMVKEYAQKNIIHRIHRWIGLFWGYILYHLGFSANLIDVARLAISLFALYLISLLLVGEKWLALLGAFLFYGQNLLDAADGSVARVRNQLTKLGEILDRIVNSFSRIAILILIGVFTQNITVIIFSIFSAFMLIIFREETSLVLPPNILFKIINMIYRASLFIQTLLFILPFILALINLFGFSIIIICYVISFYYLFLAVFWLVICLLFKKR